MLLPSWNYSHNLEKDVTAGRRAGPRLPFNKSSRHENGGGANDQDRRQADRPRAARR
jgi:hypothetical protein